MVRREAIFFGSLIVYLLIILGVVVLNIELSTTFIGLLLPMGLLVIIAPRYFSRKYNKWLETPISKKNN